MVDDFRQLLGAVVSDAEQQIGKLPVQGPPVYLASQVPPEYHATLTGLFRQQVARKPEAPALACKGKEWTYRELDERSTHLANYLKEKYSVDVGDFIGVRLEQGGWVVISILAILKLRAVYIPVATDLLRQFEAYLTKCNVIIDEYIITSFESTETSGRPISEENADCLCSLVCTNGGGGLSEIPVSHTDLLRKLRWRWSEFPFGTNEVCAVKALPGTMDHLIEIFYPLLQGVCIVIFNKETIEDTRSFIYELAHSKVSRITLSPSQIRRILSQGSLCNEKLRLLKEWISSGEMLDRSLVERFYATFPGHRLVNLYSVMDAAAGAIMFDTLATTTALPS
jgi:non-ribosomal peptide synthetase component F